MFVNGQPLVEPYAHYLFPPADETQTDGFDLRRKFGPVTVPAGHYFMMGDNRDDSQDSRFWGFLPQSYVKGRALFIYWSFDVPDDGSERRDLRRGGAGYSTRFIDPPSLKLRRGKAEKRISMKTIIKIVVAVLVLTVMFNAGRAAFNNYAFEDAVHEGLLFDPRATDDEARRHGDEARARNTRFRSTRMTSRSVRAGRTSSSDMTLHRRPSC